MRERTPSPDKVIYEPTIEFLDPEGELTREERGRVIAMGDRTARSYKELKQIVLGKKGGETPDFYLQYSLAAKSSKEIAHTSILEQVNVGVEQLGGDPPIVIEGVSTLAALRDVCSLRHFGFEAFSSRGGIFPEGYWRIPNPLTETPIAEDLAVITREIHERYLFLTAGALGYYFERMQPSEEEKERDFKWRVLNSALDDSRQVTNGVFLNHFAMHPNSALSLRDGIVRLASYELPETQAIANGLRDLAEPGLPTLMMHTGPSEYTQGLWEIKRRLVQELGIGPEEDTLLEEGRSHLKDLSVTRRAERVFLAAFLANRGNANWQESFRKLRASGEGRINQYIAQIFAGIGLHDKPPEELEVIQIHAHGLLTQGGIYELIRHRPATHIVANFAPRWGYTVPASFDEMGLRSFYIDTINLSREAWLKVGGLGPRFEEVFGPYFVARGHLIPASIRASGLDAFHIIKLRYSPNAHADLAAFTRDLDTLLKQKAPGIFRHVVKK